MRTVEGDKGEVAEGVMTVTSHDTEPGKERNEDPKLVVGAGGWRVSGLEVLGSWRIVGVLVRKRVSQKDRSVQEQNV